MRQLNAAQLVTIAISNAYKQSYREYVSVQALN